jgi:hypothetical protein
LGNLKERERLVEFVDNIKVDLKEIGTWCCGLDLSGWERNKRRTRLNTIIKKTGLHKFRIIIVSLTKIMFSIRTVLYLVCLLRYLVGYFVTTCRFKLKGRVMSILWLGFFLLPSRQIAVSKGRDLPLLRGQSHVVAVNIPTPCAWCYCTHNHANSLRLGL